MTSNLKWYVLNETDKREFEGYPYSFYDTSIRPFNVFDNIVFREYAIKLAKDYKKGKMKGWEHCKDFPTDKSPYEQFKFRLLRELQAEENGRCEYEICVSELISRDSKADKIDCYMQVLPNADIFCRYVLEEVNEIRNKNKEPYFKKVEK